jgi:hypothetical protein
VKQYNLDWEAMQVLLTGLSEGAERSSADKSLQFTVNSCKIATQRPALYPSICSVLPDSVQLQLFTAAGASHPSNMSPACCSLIINHATFTSSYKAWTSLIVAGWQVSAVKNRPPLTATHQGYYLPDPTNRKAA